MTKEQAARLLEPQMQEVLKAYAAGKGIQFKHANWHEWSDLTEPDMATFPPLLGFAYRVKPEPRQPRRIWRNENLTNQGTFFSSAIFDTREQADECAADNRIACVEFVEVIKEEK